MANDQYKEMLIEATHEDIILTNAFSGVHANMLRQSIEKAGYDVNNLSSKKEINLKIHMEKQKHGGTSGRPGTAWMRLLKLNRQKKSFKSLNSNTGRPIQYLKQSNEWIPAKQKEKEEFIL